MAAVAWWSDQGWTGGGKERAHHNQPRSQNSSILQQPGMGCAIQPVPWMGNRWIDRLKNLKKKTHNKPGAGQRRGRIANADPTRGGICWSGFVCLIELPPPSNPGFVIHIEFLPNWSWQETHEPTLKCLSYINKPGEEPQSTIKVKLQRLKMRTKTHERSGSEELQ